MSKANMREALLIAAIKLFSENGYRGVSLREIARAAEVNVGSVTYHFGTKAGLLAEIYKRHTQPMNQRRLELLGEATRLQDPEERLMAVLRAYVLPAFNSSSDHDGGGAEFTKLRAMLSAEGDAETREIIAGAFDSTSHAFQEAIVGCLPGAALVDIVWRNQFLLGALYYALINPERVTRLSGGRVDGNDREQAVEQIVATSFASYRALVRPTGEVGPMQAAQTTISATPEFMT